MTAGLPIPGRTYDISFLQGDSGLVDVTPVGPEGSATAVTGILKIAQRALLEFLTRKGSLTYLPARGTEFLNAVSQGLLRTDVDVHQYFSYAASDVLRNLASDELDSDPADERISRFELAKVVVAPGVLRLWITLAVSSGAATTLIQPIATAP